MINVLQEGDYIEDVYKGKVKCFTLLCNLEMETGSLLRDLQATQAQISKKCNEFLAQFGQGQETLEQLDSTFKSLPQGLSLVLFNKIPQGESLDKAISLEKTLKPLVQLYKTTLDDVSHQMSTYEGDDIEDIRDQVQRGDLFAALLDQYFGFLWNQLDYAAQRETLSQDIEKLEKSLLALNIDGDLKLAINQYTDFPRTQGNRKRAKAAIMKFMDNYERLSQAYRSKNQEIFTAYDVQGTPPWFLLD